MLNRKQKPSFSSGTRLFTLAVTLCLVFAFKLNASSAAEPVPPIRIAILPCTDIVKTFTQAQPLRAYLQKHLHRPIEILVPNTFQQFKRTIQLGEADFAFQAPHTYLLLANQYDPNNILLALTPTGESSHSGVIVALRDSGIKTITDLRGKKILFGHLFSTAKWLAPKTLLESEGIDLQKDLQDYAHGGSCESIAMNVYLGLVDAGAMCDYSFAELTENKTPRDDEVPPEALTVIATTWSIPTWVFTARKGIDEKTVSQTIAALLELDRQRLQHQGILKEMELGGFIRAKGSDFDSLRKRLSAAKIPHHL